MPRSSRRDNRWLASRLQLLWNSYFHDAPTGYPIEVKFGRPARYRYGSICNHGRQCRILVNGLFANAEVPEYVIDATLVHELAHYVHGYGSGLAKLHANPHRGGVIDNEMARRGCFFLEEKAGAWRRAHWQKYYLEAAAPLARRAEAKEAALNAAWEAFMMKPHFRSEKHLQSRLEELSKAFGLTEPTIHVEWLLATARRTGLSYRFRRDGTVRIHAALADSSAPDYVIDYELSYWLACEKVGGNWDRVVIAMKNAGVWERAEKAIRWRRREWKGFRAARIPDPAPYFVEP